MGQIYASQAGWVFNINKRNCVLITCILVEKQKADGYLNGLTKK